MHWKINNCHPHLLYFSSSTLTLLLAWCGVLHHREQSIEEGKFSTADGPFLRTPQKNLHRVVGGTALQLPEFDRVLKKINFKQSRLRGAVSTVFASAPIAVPPTDNSTYRMLGMVHALESSFSYVARRMGRKARASYLMEGDRNDGPSSCM